MPDLLGYDQRTKASKLASYALGALASGAIANAPNVYQGAKAYLFGRGRRSSRGMPRMRYGRRRRFRRRRARFVKKQRGGQSRGKRFTTSSKFLVPRPRLYTNFATNDFRKLRVVHNFGSFLVTEGTPLINNSRYLIHLDHWTTEWSREIEAYEEFKIANIQIVLEPTSVGTGASRFEVNPGDIPYLAAREVLPVGTTVTNLNADVVRQTPGFKFVPLLKKARTVFNITPQILVNSSVKATGSDLQVERHRRMPWMRIDPDTKALDVAAMEIRHPGLVVGAGNQLSYNVRAYATILLRGNNDELIDPYG